MTGHPPTTRYVVRTLVLMGIYVAINLTAMMGVFHNFPHPWRYVLALAVAAPVAAQIWAVIARMRESDEFVRAMLAQRFVLAAGLCIAVASGWGFLELYAGTPHISATLVYPLFWASFAIVAPFVRSSRV